MEGVAVLIFHGRLIAVNLLLLLFATIGKGKLLLNKLITRCEIQTERKKRERGGE